MLSKKEIICPEQLLKLAKAKGPAKVVIVNAGKAVSIESINSNSFCKIYRIFDESCS